jgi:hypothetical protein
VPAALKITLPVTRQEFSVTEGNHRFVWHEQTEQWDLQLNRDQPNPLAEAEGVSQ